jgi:uncharacterized membrane protein YcjF (UPF0283 family)
MEVALGIAVLMMGCLGALAFIAMMVAEIVRLRRMQRPHEEEDHDMVNLQEYRDMPDR